jgi:hypothetical protein
MAWFACMKVGDRVSPSLAGALNLTYRHNKQCQTLFQAPAPPRTGPLTFDLLLWRRAGKDLKVCPLLSSTDRGSQPATDIHDHQADGNQPSQLSLEPPRASTVLLYAFLTTVCSQEELSADRVPGPTFRITRGSVLRDGTARVKFRGVDSGVDDGSGGGGRTPLIYFRSVRRRHRAGRRRCS